MNAHKLAATLMEDGTLVLKGLPFHAGDTVEAISATMTEWNSEADELAYRNL